MTEQHHAFIVEHDADKAILDRLAINVEQRMAKDWTFLDLSVNALPTVKYCELAISAASTTAREPTKY